MKEMNPPQNPFYTVVHWMARISSIVVIGVFILMFMGEGFNPAALKPGEWVMLLFGPFGLILGMLIGWWKEGLGGAITLVCYFVALRVGGYSGSGAAYFLVCASPGILFLIAWLFSRKLPAWMIKELPASDEKTPEPLTTERQ